MLDKLKSNFETIQQRIADAATRSGRAASEVTLVGVTKYVDLETTRRLFEAGCVNLGESRPQVVWEKSAELADLPIHWHMIGHLQRNKVKRTVECCELIHSVDSERLLDAIDAAGRAIDKVVRVLIEVNVSGEAAKHGLDGSQIKSVLEKVGLLKNVKVDGLMCMAGLGSSPDAARREFADLKKLQQQHQADTPDNVELQELSMGMSGDFEMAIEEGATLVRVGSILFEGL